MIIKLWTKEILNCLVWTKTFVKIVDLKRVDKNDMGGQPVSLIKLFLRSLYLWSNQQIMLKKTILSLQGDL